MASRTDESSGADAVNRFIAAVAPISALEIRALEARPGRIVTHAPLRANQNHLGIMYAGTLYGIAEAAGGMILFPSIDFATFPPVVKSSSIHYRRPARSDITATAVLDVEVVDRVCLEVARQGRSEYDVEVILIDDQTDVVATMRGTYVMLAMSSAPKLANAGEGPPSCRRAST